MKALFVIAVLILKLTTCPAQDLDFVINSAGSASSSSGYLFAGSVGEVSVSYGEVNGFFFKEGFLPASFEKQTTLSTDLHPSPVVVYPNPTSGQVFLSGNHSFDLVRVFDSAGKLMLEQYLKANTISLDEISSGIYQLVFYDTDGKRMLNQVIFKN